MRFRELPFIKPFNYVDFRFLFLSEVCFYIPVWMAAMVFGLIATHIKGNSPFYVGLIGFGFNLPMLLGPFIGVFVDRHQRPKILRMVSLVCLLASLMMVFLLLKGWPNFWAMFLIVLIYGFSCAFYFPAIITNVSDIISDPKVVGNGTSIINSTNRIMMFFGYGLGGILLTYFSERFSFWMGAFFFLLSFILLIRVKSIVLLAKGSQSAWSELKAGFAYLKTSPAVFVIVVVLGLTGLLAWPYLFQVPVVNRYYLGGTPATLGFLLAIGGVGGTIGAFWMSARKDYLGLNKIFIFSILLLGVAMFVFAFVRSVFFAVPCLLVIDFCLMVSLTAGMIFILLIIPSEFQGRLMGIISMVSFGTIPIGSTLFYGGIGEPFGVMTAFAVAGIILIFAGFWYILQLSKIRQYSAPIFIAKNLIKDKTEAYKI